MPPKKATAPTTTDETAKPRVRLSRDAAIELYTAQNGRCFLLGGPLGKGFVVSEGHAISAEAAKLKGSRSLDELRDHIVDELARATDTVKAKTEALDAAKARHRDLATRYGDLLHEVEGGDGKAAVVVVFALESGAVSVAGKGPSPLAVEGEADGGAG